MRCWLNFIFVLFFLAILAPSCMGQDRIELGYQTTKRGIVWYRNGLPKHNPVWRLSRDTNAVIWCDTFTTLRYWWSYKDDKWITDGVLTSTLPPLPTQTSGSATIDNRQATWVPANNIRHRFDVNQTAWVPIGDWFYLANAPSNVASGGSNGAAVYTTSLWQDSDDFIVRYWDGDSWEPFGGSGSKWTDAGDYTYLTQTTDRVLVGSSSEVNINYNFQVAGDGYFEDGIRIDGPLNAGGFNGTSVQYLRSAGSGSPPQWITPENLTSGTTGEIGVAGGSNATFSAVDLRIAQQGATVGQVLKWNGTKWTPDDDISGGSAGGGIYGDGTAGSGDDNLPPGGSTVTTNNDPLQFQTAAAASLVSNILQFLVPYSADDAFTNYLAGYTPIDSVKLFNFDGGTYLKAYSGDLNLESDQIVLLTADSVQVSTVQTTTKIPAVVGINGQGTLKQIVGSANGDVLTWDGTGWEAAAGGGGGGGGVTGTGTAKQIPYWSASTTLGSTADIQLTANNDLQLANAIELKVDAAPPSAPTDGLSLYTEEKGLQFPAWIDEAGQTWEVSPSEVGSKWAKWSAYGGNTTISIWALTNTTTGTTTSRSVTSTNLFTSARRVGFVTAATANAGAGTRSNLAHYWRGNAAGLGGFYAAFRFGFSTADAANKQAFVGMYGSTGVITAGTNPSALTNIIGFALDATQTTLQFMHNDGSGTATSVDLGANFPSNTTNADLYDARIYAAPNGGTVYYWIKNLSTGNVTSGSTSSNLPSTTQLLSPHIHVSNGSSAVSVGIDVVQYEIITNY